MTCAADYIIIELEKVSANQNIYRGDKTISKRYEGLARDIVKLADGKEKINDVYYCQTTR